MDQKLDFPATSRNASAILSVLQQHLPIGDILEIASGSGQHVVHFAKHLPQNTFWPTDLDPAHLSSITAWVKEAALENIKPAVQLDVMDVAWSNARLPTTVKNKWDAIICCNMIHIAPLEATSGLFAGASKHLHKGGLLYLYGPFLGTGETDAPSNMAFDLNLKQRNSSWGVRSLSLVKQIAHANGLHFDQIIKMPANNFSILFRA